MFRGTFPALITPFTNGKVDEKAFARFVEWQITEGMHGLVPVGTTGEAPTLSHDEHKTVVELCIKTAKKRVPVIAGAGSNSTAEAIELTRFAKQAGADAALHSTGYYNKPTQEGLYLHFKAISDAVDLPIIVYNVPGRTRRRHPAGNARPHRQAQEHQGRQGRLRQSRAHVAAPALIGKNFSYLSGEDATALGFNAQGGNGCISVTSNVAPKLCSEFQDACYKGDYKRALELQNVLMPLHDGLFAETNPAPVKYAAWRIGLIESPECRLPLAPLTDATKKIVDAALAHAGLLKSKAAE